MSPLDILKTLISIPSLNPEDTEQVDWIGEARMVEWTEAFLTPLGFRCETVEITPGRPNLVARAGSLNPSKRVLIEVHSDTVAVDNMKVEPFVGLEKDGRIYGRGACDDKGPMAAALAAFTPELIKLYEENDVELIFALAAGEEKANLGAIELAEWGLAADYAIILEPTDLAPVIAHKGTLWFEIEILGRSGHGSDPAKGVNAITGMVEAIQRIRTMEAEVDSNLSDPYVGQPTYNFGVIKGGSATNIIADRCVLQVDRRTLPCEEHNEILGRIQKLLDEVVSEGFATGSAINLLISRSAFFTPPESHLIQQLEQAITEVDGPRESKGTGWFSDAGPLMGNCGEVVVFGPGSIQQAHTENEFIEIGELLKGRDVLDKLLRQLT